MWGRKQRRIDHLISYCDRMAREKHDAKQQTMFLEHRLHRSESLLAEAHDLIDKMAGTWEEQLSACRTIRSKMAEHRRGPGQEEVVRGLTEQAVENTVPVTEMTETPGV